MADDSEKFEFDVEAGKLKRAIEDVHARLFKLYAEMRKLGRSSEQWSEKQYAEMGRMAQQAANYRQELSQLEGRLRGMLGTQQKGIQQNRMYAQSTRDLNVTFLSLGYAIDDFLTVWSMRSDSIEGILAGLGAAANNFSVILAQILPGQTKILAFLPALAVAIGKVGYSFYKTSEDAEGFRKQIEDSIGYVKSLQEEMDRFNMGASKASHEKEQKKADDQLFAEETLKRQLEADRAKAIQAAQDRMRAATGEGGNVFFPGTDEWNRGIKDAAQPFDNKIADVRTRMAIIEDAKQRREEEFRKANEKKALEDAISSTGADKVIMAAIKSKIQAGQNAEKIISWAVHQGGMPQMATNAGQEVMKDLIAKSTKEIFESTAKAEIEKLGPEARKLERMKMEEEDLRNKIDISKRGEPGGFRARRVVTQEMEREREKLQEQITAQQRRADAEEKLTKDGAYLGDKLDFMAELLEKYLRMEGRLGVPLANPAN